MFGFERSGFEIHHYIGVQLDIVENEVDSKCFCCATKANVESTGKCKIRLFV